MKQMKLKEIPQNTVVHTPTKEEAKELLAILHENGYAWMIGANLIDNTYWNAYKTKTCYKIHDDQKYVSYSDNDCYEHNGDTILTLAEFKRMYCEEEKPQPKFKEGDRVVIQESYYKEELHGQIGVVINMPSPFSYYVEIDETIYQASAKDLEPYTEPETKEETMEAKELNLCELLRDCEEGVRLYSLLYGETQLRKVGHECIEIATGDGEYWTSISSDGTFADGGQVVLFPSRTLYEQYPLDPYTAWMEWQQEQEPKYYIEVHYGDVNAIDEYLDEVLFRTPADRDKCIEVIDAFLSQIQQSKSVASLCEEIKAIIEKYSKK